MNNKLLIITGGSKGIGRSIILKFVENNFSWKIITQKFIDNLKKILNE